MFFADIDRSFVLVVCVIFLEIDIKIVSSLFLFFFEIETIFFGFNDLEFLGSSDDVLDLGFFVRKFVMVFNGFKLF